MKKITLFFFLCLSMYAKELVATIHIEGMTCPLCTTAIKKSLKSIEGVKSAKVILNSKRATVTFDERVTQEELLEAIKNVGYMGDIITIK